MFRVTVVPVYLLFSEQNEYPVNINEFLQKLWKYAH